MWWALLGITCLMGAVGLIGYKLGYDTGEREGYTIGRFDRRNAPENTTLAGVKARPRHLELVRGGKR